METTMLLYIISSIIQFAALLPPETPVSMKANVLHRYFVST